MRILIIAVLLSLGLVLQDQIPETESGFYSSVMIWLFVALLFSLSK